MYVVKRYSVDTGLSIRFRFRSESRSSAFNEVVKLGFSCGDNESLGYPAAMSGEQTDLSRTSLNAAQGDGSLRSRLCWSDLAG